MHGNPDDSPGRAVTEAAIYGLRLFWIREGLGALVRPGGRQPDLCGDSLLVHAKGGFFAAADSPERNPGASREFLLKVRRMLSEPAVESGGSPGFCPDSLARRLNGLVAEVDYNSNTTFTGLFLPHAAGAKTAWFFHNGDSLLFHARRETRSVAQLSLTNHCFVGRSPGIHQKEAFEYFHDSRLLLATDGIWDIVRNLEKGRKDVLPASFLDILLDADVTEAPLAMLGLRDSHGLLGDDLGLMVVDPNFAFEKISADEVL